MKKNPEVNLLDWLSVNFKVLVFFKETERDHGKGRVKVDNDASGVLVESDNVTGDSNIRVHNLHYKDFQCTYVASKSVGSWKMAAGVIASRSKSIDQNSSNKFCYPKVVLWSDIAEFKQKDIEDIDALVLNPVEICIPRGVLDVDVMTIELLSDDSIEKAYCYVNKAELKIASFPGIINIENYSFVRYMCKDQTIGPHIECRRIKN